MQALKKCPNPTKQNAPRVITPIPSLTGSNVPEGGDCQTWGGSLVFKKKKTLSFSCAKYLCYGLEGWDYSLSIVHHGKISFSIHILKKGYRSALINIIHWNLPSRSQFLPPFSNVFNGGSFTGVCTRLYCTLTVWHGYMAMLYIVGIHWLEVFFHAGWRKSVVMYRSTERIRNVLCIFKPTGLI